MAVYVITYDTVMAFLWTALCCVCDVFGFPCGSEVFSMSVYEALSLNVAILLDGCNL